MHMHTFLEENKMKIELYLISPFEEYAGKHVCRKHWNFQWRGRRGTQSAPNRSIKLRKENFGALMQDENSVLWKLDDELYNYLKEA